MATILPQDIFSLANNPHCPHGPTILFRHAKQAGKKSEDDGYFACSAYRDSKYCHFHMPYKQKGSEKSKKVGGGLGSEYGTKKRKHDEMLEGSRPDEPPTASEVPYCKRCNKVLPDGTKHQHGNIMVDPRFPSRFLTPLDRSQNEAQFFFDTKTTQFLLDLITSQKPKRILHIGCPRLHEEVSQKLQLPSFLLDLDGRFGQFFPRNSFAHYNMFNHHFFAHSGASDLSTFLRGTSPKKVLIVMDPPFGGRVEVLAHNLRRLFTEIGGECQVVWIFPYFIEKHIVREFPSFTMLDYKVAYDNHRKFKSSSSGSTSGPRGSPVRIFTNITPASIPHPKSEGYWFCSDCDRYSAPENKHCLACGLCPSKDGKEWRHCRSCGKCVKSDWNHCKKCKRCHAKNCLSKADESVGEETNATTPKRRSWAFSGVKKDSAQH